MLRQIREGIWLYRTNGKEYDIVSEYNEDTGKTTYYINEYGHPAPVYCKESTRGYASKESAVKAIDKGTVKFK